VLKKFIPKEKRAEATLILFPGSHASLKEKPFYDEVVYQLIQSTPTPHP
jgi:hypothetical protein